MVQGILLYQLVTLMVSVVSCTMAFCVFLTEAAPLTRKFLWASLVFNVYYFLAGVAAYIIRVSGEFNSVTETIFSLGNFLLFALLVPTWTSFFLELLQRPYAGPWKWASGILGGLGVVVPLVLLALPFSPEFRSHLLRYGLYGAYAVLVLGYFVVLALAAYRQSSRVADGWKRTTLRGTGVLIGAGAPLFLVDALWPWLQVEGGWLPRAFNFQGLFLIAFGIFFGIRWAKLLRTPSDSPHPLPYDQAKLAGVDLTDRELEVFRLLFQNCSNQDLVDRLGISMGTAKNHVYHIFQKTGASSRRELLRLFRSEAEGFPTPGVPV